MSLGRKATIFVFVGVAALALLVVGSARFIVLAQFRDLELTQTSARTQDVASVVAQMTEEFSLRGKDWYEWDDLANYLEAPTREWEESNLQCPSLAAVGWSVFILRKADGHDAFAAGCDHLTGAPKPIPKELYALMTPDLLMKGARTNGAPLYGIQRLGADLYLVSSAPIRMSDASPAKVPARFITARRIDEPWLQRLEKFTRLDVSIEPGVAAGVGPDVPLVTLPSAELSRGSLALRDLAGQPSATLAVTQPRTLVSYGERILNSSLIAISVGGLLLIGATLLAMRRGVLAPVHRLLDGVKALQSGQRARVVAGARDELGVLAEGFNHMADAILDREARLATALAEVKLVLDSTGDALIGCALDGRLVGTPSRAALDWFGDPAGRSVRDWVFGDDDVAGATFGIGLDDLAADFMPVELILDQLPDRLTRDDRTLGFQYRTIVKEGVVESLLLIASDITAQVEAERADREARELQAVIGHILRDPTDFQRFLLESEELLEELARHPSLEVKKRLLHTLKGNTAIYGFGGFAAVCHHLEDQLAEDPALLDTPAVMSLKATWQIAISRVLKFAPASDSPKVVLPLAEYRAFLELVEQRAEHGRLAAEVRGWVLQPGARLVSRLVEQAERLARQKGRDVRIEVRDGGVRLAPDPMRPVLAALVHAVRNAVDHGLETPDERRAAGKPPQGVLTIELATAGDRLRLSVRDDGRGIDWERARLRAAGLGVVAADQPQIAEALFLDGLSTRDEVTELSGRGVGLAAIRDACRKLEGECKIGVGPDGVGTELLCEISVAAATRVSLKELLQRQSLRPLTSTSLRPLDLPSRAEERRVRDVVDRAVRSIAPVRGTA